jgi:hypothetical protein
LLVEQGADVNAQGGFYGNALYAASEAGDQQVLKMPSNAVAQEVQENDLMIRLDRLPEGIITSEK